MKKDLSNATDSLSAEIMADLEKTPHLFQQVLDASGLAMSIRDTSLRPIFMNKAFTDFYGFSVEEHRDTPLRAILPEATYALYVETVRPAIQSGRSWEGEYVIRTKGGRLQLVWGRFDPVLDEEGNLTHAISIMRDASAAKRLRSALTQTERHLNFLSDNTSDCLFRLRLTDWHYDYISSAVESITGYSPQEFYSISGLFLQLIPEDWMETYQTWRDEFSQGKTRYEYESPIIHKDGSRRWIHQRITLVKDNDGKPLAMEGILSDTTKRKQAEDALKAREEQYRLLAENITDVVWTLSNDNVFTYATPSVVNLWGYTPDEFLELEFPKLFTTESLQKIAQAREDRAAAEAKGDFAHVNRLELEHYHKDGSTLWAESLIRRLYSDDGKPVGYQGVSRYITERKRAEEALTESERKYRLLIETIEDVIWTMDNDLNYTYVSPSIEQLSGYTPHEYTRLNLAETVPPQSMETVQEVQRTRAEAEANGDNNFVNRFEIEHFHKDGGTLWVETITRRLLSYDGEALGFLGISRDVTPRKEAEIAIQESETRFRTLFEDSPISLWEEDLTRLKVYFDELKEQGVTDFRKFFYDNPGELGKCATLVDVVDVNRATLDLLRAKDRDDLLGNLDKVLTESSMAAFTEEMILLASGGCEYCGEITHRTLEGDIIWVVVHFSVPLEYQECLSRVIVSLIDVTPRRRAEQELRLAHSEMESRVEKRTAELSEANIRLTVEAEEREKAQEQILTLTQQLIRIQEDERQRIARDLHDNVAQDLSSIVLNMETLFDGHSAIEPQVIERGKAITDIVRGAIASVRDIAYGLRPPALDQLGLGQALERQCEEASARTGVDIDFSAIGIENASLDFDAEINIYRMVQEAINNMGKHARASRANVRLIRSHPDLLIRIEDNGQGFEVGKRMKEAAEEKRMGLRSMEERARLIGGSMEIQSLVGTGTRIIFKIPIANARRQ
ncbi:PAS domain S-box protein [Pseudodesulfovibrio sp.]|nr:PAS domain S-box protein [Pseudodesulfovibrio sp.]